MKRVFFFLPALFAVAALHAQAPYAVYGDNTAVPFLRIAPDARAAGMGDAGAASADDANAIHWNLSQLAFARQKISFAVSYTPWLRALVPDVSHSFVSFSYKRDSVSAIAASLRYFSMGNVTTGIAGTPTQFRPNEFAFDVGYTRRLTTQFAAGITARFIQSNPSGINGIFVREGGGRACAGDISFTWQGGTVGNAIRYLQPTVGLAITNIGTKMWYQDRDSASFLPGNVRLGAALLLRREVHRVILQGEVNRLLVPVPSSLNTAEVQHPVVIGGGMEYTCYGMFKVRGGYSHSYFNSGNLRYFTTGVGVEFNVFQLDVSYLIPANTIRSPLENTMRFSMLFKFGALRKTPAPAVK